MLYISPMWQCCAKLNNTHVTFHLQIIKSNNPTCLINSYQIKIGNSNLDNMLCVLLQHMAIILQRMLSLEFD